MSLKKQPVTGMKDILPDEMTLRDYLIGVIKETYRSFGFTPMETPCVEHIENLTSKQGGDNEKLIFKILKRGEKLRLADAAGEEDLCDSGLRYDLTLPLTRYYANNAAKLPSPFKALQCGSVWSGPPAEGQIPAVHAVRYRHSRRGEQSRGNRADSRDCEDLEETRAGE